MKVTFWAYSNGVLTDVTDYVRFSSEENPENETPYWGVRRQDTKQIIVADKTPLVWVATGKYEYTWSEPEPNLIYEYYLNVSHQGNRYYYERIVDASLVDQVDETGAFGRYATKGCMELRYGRDNIDAWSELDQVVNEQDKALRVDTAIQDAEDFIDSVLHGGPYVVPFAAPVPRLIIQNACILAGVNLYEGRGVQDYDGDSQPAHKLHWHRINVMKQLDMIKSGRLRLLPEPARATTTPFARRYDSTSRKLSTPSSPFELGSY